MKTNGLVIPCYNEADRLKFELFQDFIDSNKSFVLCFVNDGSTDKTLEQLTAFADLNPSSVLIFDMPENGGKAEAVRQGALHLLNVSKVENVGFIDADLATGFDDYTRLLSIQKLGRFGMVLGSRKLNGATDIERSLFRNMASASVGLLIQLIIRMPIKDTQCGAKVFSRAVAKHVFRKPFLSRWLFDVEILIRVKNKFGAKVMNYIKEVALNSWEEVEGSKITLKDSLRFPMQLLEIGYNYKLRPAFVSFQSTIKTYSPTRFSEAA